ncbi:MAG: SDR family oxidoreductase [Chloroflexi bacterium]|nr:SDR family oxidoreductase [Chloroflexota bacterium]
MAEDTVLVTGGAGFIGSHLVDRLVQEGHRVVVVDNLSTGRREHVNPRAAFYQVDITDPELHGLLRRERPRWVSHHAAQSSVLVSVRDPLYDARVNILGSLNLLEACRAAGVEKVVFASSGGAIYGEPRYLPCDEAHPLQPLAPYGVSKVAVEKYLVLYQRSFGLPSVILRYGNVYGPRQDPYGEAGVVAIFTLAMLEGRRPVVFGSGEQERDFLYVDDAVEANLHALKGAKEEAYNIGTQQGVSVNRIFALLKGIIGYEGGPQYSSPRPGEVFKVHLDNSLAAKGLGWSPRVGLEEGLVKTVEYFRHGIASP